MCCCAVSTQAQHTQPVCASGRVFLTCLCGLFVLCDSVCVVHAACNQPVRLPDSRRLPALCHEAFLALASGHTGVSLIKICARSSHVGHKHPHGCVSIVLTVLFGSRLLRGANPSCHRRRCIATNLSPFMHTLMSATSYTSSRRPRTHTQVNESHQISQAC